MMILLYVALLVLWIPLLPAALRATGHARVVIRGVVAFGLLADLYEGWMTFVWSPRVTAPIRVDIFLIMFILLALYGVAAATLLRAGWQKSGSILVVCLLVIVGGTIREFAGLARENRRLTDRFAERNRLMFAARFRSRADYETTFGLSATATAEAPIGHWRSEGETQWTRMIVNPAGRIWLFGHCGDSECEFGPEGTGLTPVAGQSGHWNATVVTNGVGQRLLTIVDQPPDRLAVTVDGRPTRFVRSPPPIATDTPPETLKYLGTFTHTECLRQHSAVTQIWLWKGPGRLFGVGIVATLVAGQRADFVLPSLAGEASRDGDRWVLHSRHSNLLQGAILSESGSAWTVRLVNRGGEQPPVLLDAAPVFHDEAMELAPRTTSADWQHWCDVVLEGHFSSAFVPAC